MHRALSCCAERWGDGTAATTGTARSVSARHIFKAREGQSVCVNVYAYDGYSSACNTWSVYVCASAGTYYRVEWDGRQAGSDGAHAALCPDTLDLKSQYDANGDDESDGWLNFGTPLQTLQQAIGGAVTVNPGGPWGSSNYDYAFPGASGYSVCLHYDYENTYSPDKPADYLATIDLRVAGQWHEKTWQARLRPIDPTPAAPGGFTASYVSATQIDLNWTDQSPVESQHLIEQSANGGQSWTALPPRPANSTSYSATGPFGPGITYQFRLRAADAFGRASVPVTCSVATPPLPAPSDLELLYFAPDGATLYWLDNADDETGFAVTWTDGSTTWTENVLADLTWLDIPGPLSPATTYSFSVRAQNAVGSSAAASLTAVSPGQPAQPANMAVNTITSTAVTLSFTDNAANEDGYVIQYSADGLSFFDLGAAPANPGMPLVIDGEFEPSTPYHFRAVGFNSFAESYPATSASITTAAWPAAPTGLSAVMGTATAITIAWEPVTAGDCLILERSQDGVNWVALTPAPLITDTNCLDDSIQPGTFYAYRLAAANSLGASYYATAWTVPAAPANATAVAISSQEALITWDLPPGPVDAFSIWVRTGEGDYEEFDYVDGSQTSYRFFSVTTGSRSFRVAAVHGWRPSSPAPALDPVDGEVAVIPVVGSIVAPPANVAVTGSACIDGVSFSWEPSYGATGYVIEWSDGSEWLAIDEVSGTSYTDEYPALGEQRYRVVACRGNLDPVYGYPPEGVYLSVHPIAPPVAWQDDNGGPNERGTLSPFSTRHGRPLEFSVLSNDIDYDGPTVTVASYTSPAHGTLSYNADTRRFTYDPADEFVGTDTFTYIVNDGFADSAPAEVAIDVTNDIPRPASLRELYQASGYTFATGVDGIPFVIAGELSAGDSDGDELEYQITQWPASGSLSLDPATHRFIYTPGSAFEGADFFKWRASDIEDGPEAFAHISLSLQLAFRNELVVLDPDTDVSWAGSVAGAWGGSVIVEQDVSHGTLTLGSNGSFVYTLDGDYKGIDTAKFRVAFGNNIQTKTQTFHFDMRKKVDANGNPVPQWPSAYASACFSGYYQVSNTYEYTFTAGDTGLKEPDTVTLSMGQPARHGQVDFPGDGSFKYVPSPVPEGEEPYFGWDFFSFFVEDDGLIWEQWVHLQVGDYPPPEIVHVYDDAPAPAPGTGVPASQWTPQPFDGTLPSLFSKLTLVEAKRNAVVRALADLGQAWQPIASTTGDIDEVFGLADPVIARLNDAQSAYLTYLDGWLELNADAASYQKTWQAYLDNYWDGETYTQVLMGIQGLPRDIGGLHANPEYLAKITQALDSFGDAAGFQTNLAGTIVIVAEIGEKVGYAASLATGGVSTGAQLLTKAGLTTLMKTVAKNYLIDKAADWTLTPVISAALSLAVKAGVNPTYLQAGMLAMQMSGLVKGLVPRCVNGNCFAAGTQVVTGVNPDGSVVTKSIENVQVGDYVMARDQLDPLDELSPRRVTQVFRRTSNHIRTLTIEGDDGNIEVIRTTDEHPFWVRDKGWTNAGDLAVGDLVQETDGSWQAVLASEREDCSGGVTVYNLEVEGGHTYFVEDGAGSADAVWAHNYCLKFTFFGRLKGRKPVAFPNAPATPRKLTKVTPEQNKRIWHEFTGEGAFSKKTPKKEEFIKWLAKNKREELKASPANFSDEVLDEMKITGKLPENNGMYEIHHKVPREFGGDNSFDNLVIIRKEPYHDALSAEISEMAKGMSPGDVRDLTFPKFEGVVFYDPS